MSRAPVRRCRMLLAAGMIAVGVAACQSAPPGPAAPSVPSFGPAPATTAPVPPAPPTTSGSPTPVAVGVVPGTVPSTWPPTPDQDVRFVGFDRPTELAEVQRMIQDPASPAASLIPDPRDPGVHELPLRPGAVVTPIDPHGFPFETCPPTSCTVDDVMDAVVGHYRQGFYAHIHVNAEHQIDEVRESAY